MKILVSGAAGYIGSTVVPSLLQADHEVVAFDKLVYGGEALLGAAHHPRFRLVVGDVRDRPLLGASLAGVEAMLHLAAVVGEPACALDEDQAQDINFGGTESALAVAKEAGVQRFLFVSTCSNYGISDVQGAIDEDAPLKPLSRYASSKVQAERLVLEQPAALCATVLRLGTICGMSPRMRFDLLVSDMARAAALGLPIRIFAPDAWRPYLHVRDAAKAVQRCLAAPMPALRNRVFNVVGENCQKKDLVGLVRKHYPATRIEVTDKQPDARDYRVSAERMARELGFQATRSVEEAFLETAHAVAEGIFRDPMWHGHSAIPDDVSRLRLGPG
ncbi:MAG TPA: NAD(P)-dependent oxidoreductase [bacterium]|nr:NAD(P)-dependent oxidoreductase [bacterium]